MPGMIHGRPCSLDPNALVRFTKGCREHMEDCGCGENGRCSHLNFFENSVGVIQDKERMSENAVVVCWQPYSDEYVYYNGDLEEVPCPGK